MSNLVEKRRLERHRSKQDAQAHVAVRPDFSHIGSLKDISQGGLGFHYSRKKDTPLLSETQSLIDIDLFVTNNEFYLDRVPCRVAYDRTAQTQQLFAVELEYRECGMASVELNAEQKIKLERFIWHYAE